MASAESVKMGSLVAPVEPDEAQDADTADPGEVEKRKAEERESGKGKYGSAKVDEAAKESADDAKPTAEELTWIEIELVDQDGKPRPGEAYKIVTSDNQTKTGTLNDKGFIRVEGIKKGDCKVTFPNLDKRTWSKA
ncbi:MAG: hypothetical protein HBSAPP03_24900 [Phycisphaerae bacterium]|nr:MAG: hypothetical protein HBSAPP03_24900 [Phycisphaerae bacterium]